MSRVTGGINEIVVEACRVDELKDGEMREVALDDTKALLVKHGNEFYAVGSKCTHFGAPLSKGVLCNGHVRCPWHNACFNVKTGDIEDFPGLDSLPKYETFVKDNKVFIKAEKDQLKSHKYVRPMVRRDKSSTERIVIIGGGPAGVVCAQTLRVEGFLGEIVIVTKENYLPYDRTKLSKAMKSTPQELELRSQQFYKDADIDIKLSSEVVSLNVRKKEIHLKNSETLIYSKLLIATGATPRRLNIEGSQLNGIHTLRTVDDANTIVASATDKHVVICGLSFIGIEAACFLADKVKSLTAIEPNEYPLPLGRDIGNAVKKLMEEKNIQFRLKTSPLSFIGSAGQLCGVRLSDNTTIEAEVCILGIGVIPNTDFLKDSYISLNAQGFVEVNQFLETRIPNVFAAGDIARVPLAESNMGEDKVNIQHWQMAHKQGQTVALNMLGKNTILKTVPFFWTMVCGKGIRYAGYTTNANDVVVHKEDEYKFIVFYIRNDIVTAVASMNFDPIVAHFSDILLAGKTLTRNEISNGNAKTWLQSFNM